MKKIINPDAKLELNCPACKRKFVMTIRELTRPGVKCPHCDLGFETSQFAKDIEKVEGMLRDFGKNLGKR